ncbi:LOW QUALITY PROTEIN: ral guanine nucleotide dissociation stimulator-like 1 [Aulostomus maculatus]
MRTVLPLCGGDDEVESHSLRSRVGRLKKLLWPCQGVDIHVDTEPGVWLRSFQVLDTDGWCESFNRIPGAAGDMQSKRTLDVQSEALQLPDQTEMQLRGMWLGLDLLKSTMISLVLSTFRARMWLLLYLGRQSWVIRVNNSGLRTHPWGELVFSEMTLDVLLPNRTDWALSVLQAQVESSGDGILSGAVRLSSHQSSRREPVLPSSDRAELPTALNFIQYHTVKVRRLKAATLKCLVTHLLNPEYQEPDYTHVMLSTYRAFTSTSTLIELLFQRDDSTNNPDSTLFNLILVPLSTLPAVTSLWLKEYSADFDEHPQYQGLRLLCGHSRHRLCLAHLSQTAESLLKRLQEQDGSQASSEHTRGSLLQEQRGELPSKDKHNLSFLTFPVRDVAEQLTRVDAELFVKVVPFHCLGCVWSQRDKKENRNQAPTIRATISQFNAVTNCVITSLLCTSSPSSSTSSPISSPFSPSALLYTSPVPGTTCYSHTSPAHRAHIIERWIAVAQTSLRAILSALLSNAVFRLKKTWASVSRESMAAFDHLCETFPDENCGLTSREILVEDGSQPDGSLTPRSKSPYLCSEQTNYKSGIVPYLGTYLTVLDTALSDTVDGEFINCEKRRREFEILSQICQLQAICTHYRLPVNPHIANWLQAHTLLTDRESYYLSCDLEAPVDPCLTSPSSWSSRLLTRLRPVSDRNLSKTQADQISVSSSGSSSSDMEEPLAPQPSPLGFNLSGSLHNVTEDNTSMSSPLRLSSPSCSSSHPELSFSSLVLNSKLQSCSNPPPPQAAQPVYNKQVADSCIIGVSVECVSNGNIYKSILFTSQDHTPQVIQRALNKHNLKDVSHNDFSLSILHNGKELQVPEKANVFYAMCTTANYDFVLRQHWRKHGRNLNVSSSPGTQARSYHANQGTSVLYSRGYYI